MIAAAARWVAGRAAAEAALVSRWGAAARGSIEDPATPLDGAAAGLALGGMPSVAGPAVNEWSALTLTAVFACVRIISGALAMLPLRVYERVPRKSRTDKYPAEDHPLYPLLHDEPHRDMSSFNWREATQAHVCLRGNGYNVIVRGDDGTPTALALLMPSAVTPDVIDGRLMYRAVLPDQRATVLPANEVLHVAGMGWDGLRGYSPIALARQSLGLSLAAEEFGARFFSNGSNPGGVIQVPQKLSDEGYEHIAASWEQAHQGLGNAHRIAILEQGATWVKTGIDPKDSQFLETRKFQVGEIARIFGVPPHMIGDIEKSTSWGSGIEQQSIGFVTHTLGPWLARWESELNRKLLLPAERRRYFIKFDVTALLRGDIAARFKAYATAIQWGWMTPNDVLAEEDRNGFDGGDEHLRPVNMAAVTADGGTTAEAAQAAGPAPGGQDPAGAETEE